MAETRKLMTVGELSILLSNYPVDTLVYVGGYSGAQYDPEYEERVPDPELHNGKLVL